MKRRRPVLLSFAGALVGAALAAGVAWATIQDGSGVIQGCYNSGGNLKIVSALPCPGGYTPLQWNQQGPPGRDGSDGVNGADGVSVTSTQLSQGDANCSDGGSRFTSATGDTYACNGADGQDATGGGLASLGDLEGIPCMGSGVQGSTHVTVDAAGVVAIRCVGIAVGLDVTVTAHCSSIGNCDRASIVIKRGGNPIGTCEAIAGPVIADETKSCHFSMPTGASVELSAVVPGIPVWSRDCATAGSNAMCNLTMSASKDVALDYH